MLATDLTRSKTIAVDLYTPYRNEILCRLFPRPTGKKEEEKERENKENYAGSENHSPHQLRKRSHFGTEYHKAPPP
jgi:hypothetical protein